MNFKKLVILVVKHQDNYIYKSEALDFFSISYSPEFDTNDYFAAARLLFELSNKMQITTIDQYSEILYNGEFRQLLGVMNRGTVLKSSLEQKVLLIDYDANFGFKSTIKPQIMEEIQEKVKKRYALLITEPYYFHNWVNIMEAMHLGLYKQENENWEVYLSFQKQFPNLTNLDGIVITGSSSAAYDTTQEWIEPLYKFIQEADEKKIKLLGICFGHQIIGHSLGGKAEKMAHVPHMQVGRRQLLSSLNWNGQVVENVNVYIVHGDRVSVLPRDVEVFLKASHCENYGFKNDHILCVQFHPEFNAIILLYIVKRQQNQELKEILLKNCYESFQQGCDNQYAIWDTMNKFLKE